MARGEIPKIVWGANTLNIGRQLDSVVVYSKPRLGSGRRIAKSGIVDVWDRGRDYCLEADVRWIPPANTTTPLATGWDGATGFNAFLVYAWGGSTVLFYPNKDAGTNITVYVDQPENDQPALEANGFRRVRLILRSLSTAFTGY